jgi:hypothetical protein
MPIPQFAAPEVSTYASRERLRLASHARFLVRAEPTSALSISILERLFAKITMMRTRLRAFTRANLKHASHDLSRTHASLAGR